jgi:hypothetical protein
VQVSECRPWLVWPWFEEYFMEAKYFRIHSKTVFSKYSFCIRILERFFCPKGERQMYSNSLQRIESGCAFVADLGAAISLKKWPQGRTLTFFFSAGMGKMKIFALDQGCQIFLVTIYQNRGKIYQNYHNVTKWI